MVSVTRASETRKTLRRATRVLALVLGLAAGVARAKCDGAPGPAGATHIEVGSIRRTLLVRLPSGYDARTPRPVVFVFHGFTMTAHLMESVVPFSNSWPEAIVIYPQGLSREFQAMPVGAQPGWQIAAGELGDRDLQFFDAMLTWVRDHHCIDESRVYVMGLSNGAFFSNLLGCERPGAIRGLAAAMGGKTCTPREPRAVILSHGTEDALVSYEQAVRVAQAWARRNGCATPPKSGAPGCSSAEACAGAPVVLCTYAGGHFYDSRFTREAAEFLKSLTAKK